MRRTAWTAVLARVIFGALVLSAAVAAIVVHPRVAVGLFLTPGAERLAGRRWVRIR